MSTISRRELLLLMLGVTPGTQDASSVNGITRLQKFIFLLEKEAGVTPSADGFEFTPYKAGPYSPRVYDDIELLENLGLIQSEITAEATKYEAADIEALEFDELISDESEQADFDGAQAADAYEEKTFALTDQGKQKIEELLKDNRYTPFVSAIRKIKSKYGSYSLCDLLFYVYTKYPEMTTESEIKEQVLRRSRK